MPLINGLPEFVTLGTSLPRATIEDDGAHYRVSVDEQARFDLPSEAYDFLRNSDYDIFLGETPRHPNEMGVDSTFYSEPGTDRLLLVNHSGEDRAAGYREDYAQFLVKDATWRRDTSDFYASYDWVTSHPAFWSGYKNRDGTVVWDTDFGLGHDAPSVWKDEDGKVQVMLETGPYMGEVRDQHSIDTRLISVADTYEQAVVILAAKLDEHYDIEGDEK